MSIKKIHFETLAIKSTENHLADARPATMSIVMASTYMRNDDGSYNHALQYGRADNPNRAVLEQSMAQLEGGKDAMAFGSGMAAINSVFHSMAPNEHVIMPHDVYFGARKLLDNIFMRWGLQVTYVDMSDVQLVADAITPTTSLIWLESPSNPMLNITDLGAIISLAKTKNIRTAVDNTWPTPVLTRPIEMGADVVVHSTTKYIGGHSDVIGGCVVVANKDEFSERIRHIQHLGGGVPSPFDCWLVARGIRTLSLRVKAQSETALHLANFLQNHVGVERVLYPGLPSHSGYEIAKKQMKNGFGGMISIIIKGDYKKTLEISNRLQYFTRATSLGGVESLVEHRRSVEGPTSNAPENLLRISVGLEHVSDLTADWEQALAN